MISNHNPETRERAAARVAKMKKFYNSVFTYVIFIGALAGLNYYVDGLRHPWFLWAALGWGIGLLFQAADAFQWNFGFSKSWEEKKVKELMDKENRNL